MSKGVKVAIRCMLAISFLSCICVPSQEKVIDDFKKEMKEVRTATAAAITPSPTPLPYGAFDLVLSERSGYFEVTHDFLGVTGSLSSQAKASKGLDVYLVLVRIANDGDRWIFPLNMPGRLVDKQGDVYHEKMDRVVKESAACSDPNVGCLITSSGEAIVLSLPHGEPGLIGPGETFTLAFLFHVPQNRAMDKFVYRYIVRPTADPLVGERWQLQKVITLSGQ